MSPSPHVPGGTHASSRRKSLRPTQADPQMTHTEDSCLLMVVKGPSRPKLAAFVLKDGRRQGAWL